ncbi:hypothetical protein APHCRT_0407 [Anaplasma phagocytophilum str. CRT53-1]|uniref:Uncharacterized protein n=1 Tax=Anaplasma phagocytophilum str. CRT53-1 TaxID=1359157 RepID=A0A0F3Q5T1_ANAPH|nr:hypothetical protein APHCRT_0407 [Anaplasma phagocytophilum str. CRT53-1]
MSTKRYQVLVMHITRYQGQQKEKCFCNLCSNLNNKRYDIVLGF